MAKVSWVSILIVFISSKRPCPLTGRFHRLLKPGFTKTALSAGLPWIKQTVAQFLDSLPTDGTTFDMGPLLDDLVCAHEDRVLNLIANDEQYFDMSFKFILGRSMTDLGSKDAHPNISLARFEEAWEKAQLGAGVRVMLGKVRKLLPTAKWYKECDIVHQFIGHYVKIWSS